MLRLKVLASTVPLAIAALFASGEFLTAPRTCIEIADTSVRIAAPSRRAHGHGPPRLVAISRNPSASDPLIYLSRDGPADDRIFVSSNGFSLPDAAALIVVAQGERHRVEAASFLG